MAGSPVPRYVYKYQAVSECSLGSLKQRSLWCSHPSNFNDPFDCSEAMLWNRPREVISNVYLDFILNANWEQMMTHAAGILAAENNCEDKDAFSPADTFLNQHLSSSQGVACFSELRDHLLMWGHYAQRHTGFCLEFDTSFDPFTNKLRQVVYQARMPTLEPSVREYGDQRDPTSFLLVKAKEWRYEREWRLLHETADSPVSYPCEALSAVYLGARITKDAEERLLASLPHKLRVFRMNLATDRYKLISAIA